MHWKRHRQSVWFVAALVCVLGLWQAVSAQNKGAPGAGQPPFASAVDQRNEMIRELQQMRVLLKEQNDLLKQYLEIQHGGAKPKR